MTRTRTTQRPRLGSGLPVGLLLVALAALLGADQAIAATLAGAGDTTANGAQLPALTSTPLANGGSAYAINIQTLLFFGALSFLPALLLMTTAFTRIVIVLSLLRHALGLQTSPPNQVIVGLSLFLTFFVMSPTIDRVLNDAWTPYSQNKIDASRALELAEAPMKNFMMKQTRQADLAMFAKIAHVPPMQGPESVPIRILIPAFVTSELKTAFLIGFAVFIPFLIIDLVVASILMSMGMMMVSPSILSMPFKLLLFVLVDGWQLLCGSLVQSFVI